jgi:2-isopropylmalate synthase
VDTGASARAASYVKIALEDGRSRYGAGIDANLTRSSLKAIVSALNLLETDAA